MQSWVALFCFCLRACIPGMLSDYGLGALGRLVIQCYTLVSHLSPLVSHLSPTHLHFAWCAWCASTAPTQQHWTGRDKKQRPSKEGDQLQQTSTSSTCPKKRARGRQEHQPKIPKSNQSRAGKGKGPGNLSLEKRDQKRDANEIRALAAANSRKVKSEGWITWRRSLHGITHWRSTSRQNPAGTDSNRRGQNHTEPKYDKFQWARLSRNYWQWHHDKDCNQYHTGLYK